MHSNRACTEGDAATTAIEICSDKVSLAYMGDGCSLSLSSVHAWISEKYQIKVAHATIEIAQTALRRIEWMDKVAKGEFGNLTPNTILERNALSKSSRLIVRSFQERETSQCCHAGADGMFEITSGPPVCFFIFFLRRELSAECSKKSVSVVGIVVHEISPNVGATSKARKESEPVGKVRQRTPKTMPDAIRNVAGPT